MKSLKTKVILSAVVLLFALVATIGSTYAWFTVSQTVSVSSIEMNVQSAKSLLILVDDEGDTGTGDVLDGYDYSGNSVDTAYLLDPTNYSTSLTNANILGSALYDTELATWTLGHVTAGNIADTPSNIVTDFDGLDASSLQTMDIDSKVYSSATRNGSAGYIEIDFWVLNQSIGSENIVLQDLTFTSDALNSTVQDNVVNALRLRTWDNASNYQIFGTDITPEYNFEFVSGMRGYDGDATDSILQAAQDLMVADHALYYNSGEADDLSHVYVGTGTGLTGATVIASLASNTPTKMSFAIYLEGWDEDTTNALLSATFTVSFTLALQNPS